MEGKGHWGCLFTPLLCLAIRIFAQITALMRCCLPPKACCNEISAALSESSKREYYVCLWEVDGQLLKFIDLYHLRSWSIVSIQKPRDRTLPSQSSCQKAQIWYFMGPIWYLKQSQQNEKTLYFSTGDFFNVSYNQEIGKAQRKLFI